MDRRGADRLRSLGLRCARAGPFRDHGIGAHRTSNILEALLAQIGELDRDLADNLFVSRRRNADAPRFGDAFKTGCNVDAIAKNVMRLNNNVADIDANAKGDALFVRVANREVMDALLE